MSKQKVIAVDERTHEILRREGLAQSAEQAAKGITETVSLGKLLKMIADNINISRNFPNLPTDGEKPESK